MVRANDRTGRDPGGDDHGGDANAETVEIESFWRLAVGRRRCGRHDVIVNPAVLVVNDDEQAFMSAGAAADRVVARRD